MQLTLFQLVSVDYCCVRLRYGPSCVWCVLCLCPEILAGCERICGCRVLLVRIEVPVASWWVKAFSEGSIVSTKTFCLVETNIQHSSCLIVFTRTYWVSTCKVRRSWKIRRDTRTLLGTRALNVPLLSASPMRGDNHRWKVQLHIPAFFNRSVVESAQKSW